MTDANQPPGSAGLLCPVCRVDLVMSERQGVEIDYCPRCRGVWLDRGELDKILERAGTSEPAAPPAGYPPPPAGYPAAGYPAAGYPDPRGYDDHHGHHHDDHHRGHHGGHHRRRSFLHDLFD